MQLNEGKFSANGRCGYVLKPQYLMDETFKPDQVFAQGNGLLLTSGTFYNI